MTLIWDPKRTMSAFSINPVFAQAKREVPADVMLTKVP